MCRSLFDKSFGVVNYLAGVTGEETLFLSCSFTLFTSMEVGCWKKFTKLIDTFDRIALSTSAVCIDCNSRCYRTVRY